MSLNFANTSTADVVNCGSAAAIDNWTSFSIVAWIYPTASVADGETRQIRHKGSSFRQAFVTPFYPADSLEMRIGRSIAAADKASVANQLVINAWNFVAVTYNETDSIKLYWGNLTTSVAEVSYALTTAGSGTTSADAADSLIWGNANGGVAADGFQGRIGRSMYINRSMVLADLLRIQFAPIRVWNSFTEAKALYEFWGTTTLHDVSGNANAGTISGDVTTANHVPLGAPFGIDSGYMPYVVAAATYPGWFVNSKGGWW